MQDELQSERRGSNRDAEVSVDKSYRKTKDRTMVCTKSHASKMIAMHVL
jgi:hypothetical protein